MDSPSSARETVRDLLVQALGALANEGFIPALPANVPIERAKRAGVVPKPKRIVIGTTPRVIATNAMTLPS